MDKKAYIVIFLIVLTDIIGFGLFIPLMPVISQMLQVSGFKLGFLMASYAIAQFFAAPYLGSLSDKYGRKPILLISKLGTVIAYLIFAFSRQYYLILLSRLIDGFTGGNISAARAYISDISTPQTRPKGMALIGIAFGIGFIIGPAIGGIFYNIGNSILYPALFGALLCFLSLILTVILLKDTPRHPDSKVTFRLPNFIHLFRQNPSDRILLTQLLFTICISIFQTSLALYTAQILGYSVKQNSHLFVFMGLLTLIIQGLIVKKGGKRLNFLTGVSLIISTLGLIVLSRVQTIPFLFISIALILTGTSIANAFIPTILLNYPSDQPEGKLLGNYEGYSSLARIIGPAIGGSFIIHYPRQLFLCTAVVLFLVIFLIPRRSLKF